MLGALALLPQHASVEQTAQGTRPPAQLVDRFDGIGVGFEGPQGKYEGRSPSDNSLAVGPNHIVQTVNSRLAVFTKKGKRYDSTGRILYGQSQVRARRSTDTPEEREEGLTLRVLCPGVSGGLTVVAAMVDAGGLVRAGRGVGG